MAVSRPIQTQAQGLLGFLQLKNTGQNPADLPDVLQPVLEMRDWFWQTNSEILTAAVGAQAAAGFVLYATVPDNEYWVVHDVGLFFTLAAASTVRYALIYRNLPSGLGAAAIPLTEYRTQVEASDGNINLMNITNPRRPLLIPPGGAIGVHYSVVSAATAGGQLTVRFTRLKV